MTDTQGRRKQFEGVVTSNKMKNTVVVKVARRVRDPKYGKVINLYKKFYAHTTSDGHKIGDLVKIVETRPLSKLKRWRVV